ncbi:glycosyltransferase [Candidatus Daviesbacteria bacterium]|nr:glycosyltransferase [Candidatus Daviesbacteria bacterium]
MSKNLKIALVHDDLVQWGGAERVLATLAQIYPESLIYTSLFDSNSNLLRQNFDVGRIRTSFLQKIPGWKNFYKALLPLYPIAFEQFDFSNFDLVISQTTRFAKSVITKPSTKHICYCHTPPRFLWNFSGEVSNFWLSPYLSFLRVYDQVSSRRVDFWIAGSNNAKLRIKKIYRTDSKVIPPFVDLSRFRDVESFEGSYLLVISRLNWYKRVDIVLEAAKKLDLPLKVVGVGPELGNLQRRASKKVEFLGHVGEDDLSTLIAGCWALVVAGEEDFGLTSLEAQALAKPVVAYRAGGTLETVIEGETGYFFDDQSAESLIRALGQLDKRGYNKKTCVQNAQRYSQEKFMEEFSALVNSL